MTSKFIRNALLLVLTSLLGACAATSNGPQQDSTSPHPVLERAQQRWEILLSGDLAAAYAYLSPGYRSSVSSLDYQRGVLVQKVRWKDARIVGSECLELTCDVRVDVDFEIIGVLPGVPRYANTDKTTEQWVKIGENWWFVPQQ